MQRLHTGLAVDREGEDRGVDRGDRGRFGRSEDAAIDAAHDQERQSEYRQGMAQCLRSGNCRQHDGPVAPVRRAGVIAQPHHVGAHRGRQHQARAERREENVRHGNLDDGRVDDERDRGRDQDAQPAGGGDHADREAALVAGIDHLRDHHTADRHGSGDAGAAHGGKNDGGDHRHQRQTAAQVSDRGFGRGHQSIGRPALAQQIGGENEERDGDQFGFVEEPEHRRTDGRMVRTCEQEIRHADQHDRKCDRHAGEQHRKKQYARQGECGAAAHGISSGSGSLSA